MILDLTPIVWSLAGLLPTLARTLADVGLTETFAQLGRAQHTQTALAIEEQLRSEPRLERLFQLTLTGDDAARLVSELDDASVAPDRCLVRGCGWYAVWQGFCGRHCDDEGVA